MIKIDFNRLCKSAALKLCGVLFTSTALGAPLNSAVVATPLKVMLDPGHGGYDSGAVVAGIREADLVLQVTRHLKDLLKDDPRFEILVTRDRDLKVSLNERVKKAEQAKVDLFLSLHVNSNSDHRVQGMEVYIQNHLPADDESLLLASLENQKEIIHNQSLDTADSQSLSKKTDLAMIIEDLRQAGRLKSSHRLSSHLAEAWPSKNLAVSGTSQAPNKQKPAIRQAPFFVITKLGIPAALIELGFLTHPKERELLNQKQTQKEMADAIYKGLISYLLDKDSGGELRSMDANRRPATESTSNN